MSNALGPLAGYRVIDFGQYLAGPLTAMLLADQGAEVIRVDPPDGPFWKTPANAVLNRGKKSIVLDLKKGSDLEIARNLVRSADVLIENFRPGVMDRLGLGAAWAREENPDLIYLSIPGFPESDVRRRNWRAWEGIVAAATSHYSDASIRKLLIEDAPLYSALPMTSYYAGIEGAIAVCLSLIQRHEVGQGGTVEVPLLNASMSAFGYMSLAIGGLSERYRILADMPEEIGLQSFPQMRSRGEYAAMRDIYDEWRLPLCFNYTCSDGRLLFICAAFTRLHTDRAVRLLGLEPVLADLGFHREDLYEDRQDDLSKNLYSFEHWSAEDRRLVREHLQAIIATRSAREWEAELGNSGVPCAVQRSTEEYIKEDWVRDAKLMCQVMTPDYGPMWQPNRAIYFPQDAYSSQELPSPRRLDEDRNEILNLLQASAPKKKIANKHNQISSNPLKGIKVLDLTNVISGPTCGRTLAECGADVIKIDSPHPSHGPEFTIGIGLDVNRGKRSMLLDLKKQEAKGVFNKLLCNADVVIYNGPNEVIERLGLTFSELSKVNPRVILCQITAFGSTNGGAWATRQGYDEVVQASNGCQVRFGGAEDPLLHGTASCLDFSTGYLAALAVSFALIKRQKTGVGSHVCTSLALAGQLVQLPFCFDFEGRGSWTEAQGQDSLGSSPVNRLYRTADGWIFLAQPLDEATKLAEIQELGLCGDETLQELESSLENVFLSKTTCEWENLLNPLQVGAHRVFSLAELRASCLRRIEEPSQFSDSNQDIPPVFLRYQHEIGTTVDHLAPSWMRGDLAGLQMGLAAPRYGEHTERILQELGYGASEIASMLETGAVATRWGTSEKYLPS